MSATWVRFGLLPMVLGAFLIVIGLFMVRFAKLRTKPMGRVSVVALPLGMAILGLAFLTVVQSAQATTALGRGTLSE